MSKIAVGVGFVFNIFEKEEVSHINLKAAGTEVFVDKVIYTIYKGETYEASQRVDEMLDQKVDLIVDDYIH